MASGAFRLATSRLAAPLAATKSPNTTHQHHPPPHPHCYLRFELHGAVVQQVKQVAPELPRLLRHRDLQPTGK